MGMMLGNSQFIYHPSIYLSSYLTQFNNFLSYFKFIAALKCLFAEHQHAQPNQRGDMLVIPFTFFKLA
jgi:hypothetical protein